MTLRSSGLVALQAIARSAAHEAGPVRTLEIELMQEKAAALGRVTRRFERALAAYEAAGADRMADDARRADLRDAAAQALWEFVVQREACGLRNTEAVLREYSVPAALPRRMGVALRG